MRPIPGTRALAAVIIFLTGVCARAACPVRAPGLIALGISGGCNSYIACPNGPLTLTLSPWNSYFPPFIEGYIISPCDTVTWDFGDGTTKSLTGSDRVTHDYPLAGNYIVKATVTNSLGSETVSYLDSNGAVIATSPGRLSFSLGKGGYPGGACDNCIVVREDNGPVTITVLRTGDMSRTISTEVDVIGYPAFRTVATLSFAPSETSKRFMMPITNDQVFSGTKQFVPLSFGKTTGGTLTMNASSQAALVILEDDPPPTFSIEPTAAVFEGDSGLTQVSIPVHLIAPMGVACDADTFFEPGTAGWTDVSLVGGAWIEAGQTSGLVTAWVRGNTLPEPDKSFQIRIAPRPTTTDPLFDLTPTTVTIINDDAALYPAQTAGLTNTPTLLALDIGSPYLLPVSAIFTSSAPDIVPAPAPVSIPAGATKATVVVTPRAAGRAQISAVVPARTVQPATITVTAAAAPVRRRAATH